MKLTPVLRHLTAGQFKSVKELAQSARIDADAVSESISGLEEVGVPVVRNGLGEIALSRQIQPLDSERLRHQLQAIDPLLASRVEVFEIIDSTNQHLLDYEPSNALHKRICVAEHMTAGRGRRGRRWHCGAFENIMMSMAWNFDRAIELSGLSLAVGTMTARAVEHLLGINVQVKWPNDIVFSDRKLGGILIEIQDSVAVVGIGLNCRIGISDSASIGQPTISLDDIAGSAPDRTRLIASLASSLNSGMQRFSRHGFQWFKDEWLSLHAYQGRFVSTGGAEDSVAGHVVGVADDGALLIRQSNGLIAAVNSGEVSAALA